MKPKYQFYEIVRVIRNDPEVENLMGQQGAIFGMSQDEQRVREYAVYLYELDEVWVFLEEELEPTGRMDKRESFYDGTTIRVIVDPETGEGNIAG